MRKILVIAFVLFLAAPTVKAGMIIAEEGLLDDEYLSYEDAELTDGAVNWHKEGCYALTYRKDTGEVFTRNVVILTPGQLLSGYEIKTEYARIDCDEAVYIEEVLFGEDNDFYVYGTIDRGGGYYSPIYTERYLYAAYYKEGRLVWEDTPYPERYGCFSSACLTPEGFALIGDYDSYTEGRNIIICIYNNYGIMTRRREIRGSGNDFSNKIFFYNGVYRFVGTGNSRDKEYDFRTGYDYDIICGAWEPASDGLLLNGFGNSGDDIYLGSVMLGGDIGILAEFIGAGVYRAEGSGPAPLLVRVGADCEVSAYAGIAHNVFRVFGDEESFILACLDQNPRRLLLYYYNRDLKKYKTITVILPDNLSIYDLKLITSGCCISLYATGAVKGNACVIKETDLGGVIQDENIVYTGDSMFIIGFQKGASGEIMYADMSYDRKRMSVNGYTHIFRKEIISDLRVYVFHNNVVYINRIYADYFVPITNPYKNVEFPYGYYPRIEKLSLGGTDIYLSGGVYCEPFLNTKEYETYDIGHRLVFGGQGYLNGNPVPNLSYIFIPGSYILEIVGNSDERRIIPFSVDYLSETAADIPEIESISYFSIRSAYKSNGVSEPDISFTNTKPYEDEPAPNELMYACAGVAGLMAGSLLPVKKKGDF